MINISPLNAAFDKDVQLLALPICDDEDDGEDDGDDNDEND